MTKYTIAGGAAGGGKTGKLVEKALEGGKRVAFFQSAGQNTAKGVALDSIGRGMSRDDRFFWEQFAPWVDSKQADYLYTEWVKIRRWDDPIPRLTLERGRQVVHESIQREYLDWCKKKTEEKPCTLRPEDDPQPMFIDISKFLFSVPCSSAKCGLKIEFVLSTVPRTLLVPEQCSQVGSDLFCRICTDMGVDIEYRNWCARTP